MRSFKIRRNKIEDLMENFVQAEHRRASWPQKMYLYDIGIASTADLAGDVIESPELEETILRPAPFYRLTGGLLLGLGAYIWWLCYRAGSEGVIPEALALFSLLALSILMVGTLVYFFLSKRYNYELRLNSGGVWFRGESVRWPELRETAIMRKSGRRLRRFYLILFRRDGTAITLRLSMFGVNVDWLAMVVEGYKKMGKA